MILTEDILALHNKSIEKYGGAYGVRDLALLESALARPFQTFDSIDLYPSIFEKVASLGESLIKNHPFLDGNKRIGFLSMIALLEINELVYTANQKESYDFIIDIATGNIHFDQIVDFLKVNTQSQ
jgi:death-on-curing protein